MNVPIKSPDEVVKMQEAGKILAEIMDDIWTKVAVSVKTSHLDKVAFDLCEKHKVRPAFLNYEDSESKHRFPATICACINKETVHGIPSEKKEINDGDLLTIDMGIEIDGWYSDMARSKVVGKNDIQKQKVVDAANEALVNATKMCVPGKHLKDISETLYSTAAKYGCTPMLEFVGHGIGKNLHEEPAVPGYWVEGIYENIKLKEGIVLAIEAIITSGNEVEAKISKRDHWTAWPKDNAVTACAENTVAISDHPKVLTSR